VLRTVCRWKAATFFRTCVLQATAKSISFKAPSFFVYIDVSTCWSELWFNKILQKSRVVYLTDVARMFQFGTIMQDVVCSLHLATFTEIWAAQAHYFHVGRKSVLRRLRWTQAFLGRSQSGGCEPNVWMKELLQTLMVCTWMKNKDTTCDSHHKHNSANT